VFLGFWLGSSSKVLAENDNGAQDGIEAYEGFREGISDFISYGAWLILVPFTVLLLMAIAWYVGRGHFAGHVNFVLGVISNVQEANVNRRAQSRDLNKKGLRIVIADRMNEKKLSVSNVTNLSKLSDEDKRAAIIEADPEVLVVRSKTQVRRDLIDELPNLKYIIRAGHGTNNIDVDYAESKGIEVIKTLGSEGSVSALALRKVAKAKAIHQAREIATNDAELAASPASEIAEHDTGDDANAVYKIAGSDADSDASPVSRFADNNVDHAPSSLLKIVDWGKAVGKKNEGLDETARKAATMKAMEIFEPLAEATLEGLKGETIGIIGFGVIGQVMAFIATNMGMKVVVHSNSLMEDPSPATDLGYGVASKEEIANSVDYIVLITGLHKTGLRANVGMVGKELVDIMIKNKKLKALVNVDREGLVVEEEIKRLISKGRVQYLVDEIPEDEELRVQVLYTNHIGASTTEAERQVHSRTREIFARILVP